MCSPRTDLPPVTIVLCVHGGETRRTTPPNRPTLSAPLHWPPNVGQGQVFGNMNLTGWHASPNQNT